MTMLAPTFPNAEWLKSLVGTRPIKPDELDAVVQNPWEIVCSEITFDVKLGGYTEPYWDQDGRYRVRWCPERMVTRCWRSSFLGWCRGLTPHENRDITT